MIAVVLILAGLVVGVALGFVRGGWWAVWAAAALVGGVAWVAQDAWTALAYAIAAAAGVGIGVGVRRHGPRAVPPPG
jgi:hypothetical protein